MKMIPGLTWAVALEGCAKFHLHLSQMLNAPFTFLKKRINWSENGEILVRATVARSHDPCEPMRSCAYYSGKQLLTS